MRTRQDWTKKNGCLSLSDLVFMTMLKLIVKFIFPLSLSCLWAAHLRATRALFPHMCKHVIGEEGQEFHCEKGQEEQVRCVEILGMAVLNLSLWATKQLPGGWRIPQVGPPHCFCWLAPSRCISSKAVKFRFYFWSISCSCTGQFQLCC